MNNLIYKLSLLSCIKYFCLSCTVITDSPMETMSDSHQNTFLAPWEGDFNGVPNFHLVKLEDLKPAFHHAMDAQLSQIEQIAQQEEPANFENTIVALETTNTTLNQVYAYYGVLSSNLSSVEFRAIEAQVAPEISDHFSQIWQNEDLFERIRTVYDNADQSNLLPDEKRLVEHVYEAFARNGSNLNQNDKKRFKDINRRLAELYMLFSSNVLADEEGYVTFLRGDELAGLPASYVAAAREAANSRGKPGYYAVTNTRSSMEPFLTYSELRELRKKVWSRYYGRGSNRDDRDNNKIITEILNLRHKRSILLGYKSFAHWKLENNMAHTPEKAMNLLYSVWPKAIKRVQEEVLDMQNLADSEGSGVTIAPWDYRFYAEKVRKQRFQLDSDELRQYLQLDNLIQALFFVADKVFGYSFTLIEDGRVPVFHPDVRVWRVNDKSSGKHVGLWYLDPFARKGKEAN